MLDKYLRPSKDFLISESEILNFTRYIDPEFKPANEFESIFIDGKTFFYCERIPYEIKTEFDIEQLNKVLRNKLDGFTSTDLSMKSKVSMSNISKWTKGIDLGIKALQKLADAYDYTIFAEIRIKI